MPQTAYTIPEAGPVLTTAEIIVLSEFVEKRSDRLGKVIDDLEAGVKDRVDQTRRSLDAAGIPKAQQTQAVQKAHAAARRELLAASEETRWGILREVSESTSSANSTATLFASPQAMLAGEGLGTTERTNYEAQLAGTGPVHMRNMAAIAISRHDLTLGAALMAVVERMPRRDRPFAVAELAQRLVGDRHEKLTKAVARLRNSAQRTIIRNREFESGRRQLLARVSNALSSKEA